MTAPARSQSDKFARFREKKRAQGLREIRLWVPDVQVPGFREQVAREVASLQVEDELNVETWLEQVQSDIDWGPAYDWGPDSPPGGGRA